MSFLTTTLRAANNPNWLPPSAPNPLTATNEIRYALLPSSDEGAKVRLFSSLAQLASAIHRARAGQAIELAEVEDFAVKGHPHAFRAVEVHILSEGNDRTGFVGFAYLDNHGSATLRAALQRSQSTIIGSETQ